MKAVLVVLLLILSAPLLPAHATSHVPQTSQQCQNYFLSISSGSCPVDYLTMGIVPGNLQVVAVSTNDTSVHVVSVTDSIGDRFILGIEDTTTFLHTELWYSIASHTQTSKDFNYSVTMSSAPKYWDMNVLAFNYTNVNSVQVTSKGESDSNTNSVEVSPVSISNSLVVGFVDLYNKTLPDSPTVTNDGTLISMPNTKYLGPTAAALYANFNYTSSGTLDPPNPIQQFTNPNYNGQMLVPGGIANGYSYLLMAFQSSSPSNTVTLPLVLLVAIVSISGIVLIKKKYLPGKAT